MIKIYYRSIKEKSLKRLEELKKGSWIFVESPTKKELDYLSEKFSLERSLLQDAIDPYEVPRLEIHKDIVYIFTRFPCQKMTRVFTAPLLIAIAPDFILTLSMESLSFLQVFLEQRIEFYTTQKTKFLLQIFSQINQLYNRFLTEISKQVRAISVELEKIENRDIIKFVGFEEILNDFLSALVPTNALLNKLLSGNIIPLFAPDKELIEDLFLSNEQLIELSKSTLKNIVNIREAYSTIMTNNLNRVMKFFTTLTIILTIPMIISGFYGMNVSLPFSKSPLAFLGLVALSSVISLILLFIFMKKRWL